MAVTKNGIQLILYMRHNIILFAYVNKSGKNQRLLMVCVLIMKDKVISYWISIKRKELEFGWHCNLHSIIRFLVKWKESVPFLWSWPCHFWSGLNHFGFHFFFNEITMAWLEYKMRYLSLFVDSTII